jgi:hypothetical protein
VCVCARARVRACVRACVHLGPVEGLADVIVGPDLPGRAGATRTAAPASRGAAAGLRTLQPVRMIYSCTLFCVRLTRVNCVWHARSP